MCHEKLITFPGAMQTMTGQLQ